MYRVNYNFSSVSNEIEAYILGYLYADGYVMGAPFYRLGMMLAIKDEAILKKIKDYISLELPISYGVSGSKFPNCKFVLCRKEIVENLAKLGMKPNKTHTEFTIPKLNKGLQRHFIRGYLDGDGTVVLDRGKYLKISICSPTSSILRSFSDELTKIGIDCHINKDNRIGKPSSFGGIMNMDQYRIVISKRIHIEKLYDFLYKEATIYLERKHGKFKEYIDNSPLQRKSNNLELLEYKGEVKSIHEWSKELHIRKDTLVYRLNKVSADTSLAFSPSFLKEVEKYKVRHLGENTAQSILTNRQVRKIFKSTKTNGILATKYSTDRTTIDKIRARVNYKSVTKDLVGPTYNKKLGKWEYINNI